MELAKLPRWEMCIYWFLSFASHFYSFYQLYIFSKEHEESLDGEGQLDKRLFVWSNRKDPTDFEWSFWIKWARQSFLWSMSGHAFMSQISSVYLPQYRKGVLTAYGILCAWWLLGSKGVAVLMLHLSISLAVAQLQNTILCWGCTLLLLSTLHINYLQDIQRVWYHTDERLYLLLFSAAMCSLRCISFNLELVWSPLDDGETNLPFSGIRIFMRQLYNLTAYCFYHPLFYNGPVVNYNDFRQQMDQPASRVSAMWLLVQILRVYAWWSLAELLIHFMYMHTIQNSETYLNMLPPWALGGLALALVQFFFVKYLVLYGAVSLLVKLDGLEPPPLPRCVSIMYSFRGMWRTFDVGLYRWLIRYLYVPMGGSQRGVFLKLVSSALAFGFMSLWHGFHDYLQCWALLNWVCVAVENAIALFLQWPPLHQLIVKYLPPSMRRRGLALISAFSTAMLILSNLVFLGGIQIGLVYWKKVFVQGWCTIGVPMLGFLYCFAQVGLEVDRERFR